MLLTKEEAQTIFEILTKYPLVSEGQIEFENTMVYLDGEFGFTVVNNDRETEEYDTAQDIAEAYGIKYAEA